MVSKAFGIMNITITRFILLTVLLLLLAACSNEEPLPPSGEPANLARLMVTGSGIFKVEAASLAALGWTSESPLTLSMNEEALPFQVHEGTLYFYLPDDINARYSNQHVLWLSHGASLEPPTSPSDETPISTVMQEQKLTGTELYSANHLGDPWFWVTLVAPTTETYEVLTAERQKGAVTVTVRAAGVTKVPHQLMVSLNEKEAGTLSWNGQERHEESFTLEVEASEKINVTFELPESESGIDMSMLDDVIVSYPSQPEAVEGFFKGRAEEEGVAEFSALGEDIVAWQLEPDLMPLKVEQQRVFLPANQTFVVSQRDNAQSAVIERVEDTKIVTEGADYLAIVVPELKEALEPLLAFHREQGLSVLVLETQQVYDAYSAGITDPFAFRDLLADADATWEEKPRFVLLVGDSTYDPNGYKNELPPTYLPSPFIDTVFGGETVSDNVIADIDDDGYPDVALGRLPARSAEQLETMIDKITLYTQQPAEGAWRERVVFAADGREELFQRTSEGLRNDIPIDLETVTIYPEAAEDAMSEMIPALNEGSLIVNYVGHGSVEQWGRDELLTVEGASELSNGQRLPLFINMTCLTGLFSHPSQESLAETLLWAKNGGAIAAVAPSSLTLPTNQSKLNQALLKELLETEKPTIGEALMRAKQQVPLTNNNEHDIVATFNLLGDPAIVMQTK